MKKIGILTYHHVVNWGSALQAYCMQKLLEKLYPAAVVEIVDYVPRTSFLYSQSRIYKDTGRFFFRKRIQNRTYQKQQAILNSFLKINCTLSKSSLCSDSIIAGREFLIAQGYDMVVVGSDTVFQVGPYGGRYIAAPQAPNLYFLPFPAPFKKVALAVSVDPFQSELLETIDTETIRDAINDFDVVFYRDEATRAAIQMMGAHPTMFSYMPDPTLLMDFGMLVKKPPSAPAKLAAVAIGSNELTREICTTLSKSGFKPITLLSKISVPDIRTIDNIATVEEFLSLHRQFDLIVTDRFHGSIFSMVMGACPVIGIEKAQLYSDSNSKLRDLFGRLGLEAMLVRYNGQKMDTEWLETILPNWQYSKRDIIARIEKLRQTALENLRVLF